MNELLNHYHSRAKTLICDQSKYLEANKLQKEKVKIQMRIEKIEREFYGKWSGNTVYESKGLDGTIMVELKICVKDFEYTHWQTTLSSFMHFLGQIEGNPTGWALVSFEKKGALTVPVVQELFELQDQPEKEIPLNPSVAA